MKYFVGVEVDAESPEVAQSPATEIFGAEWWVELIVSAKDGVGLACPRISGRK